ncbi:MAG: hypothetical protein DCC75_05490 [Proteobacteria bacterium]|nr:MAG: hypothetical protein DCC75_05490 [Pseudomonadota bacterium]
MRLDFPEVSSKHARLGFESGKFWVEDLGSTNGTFIGGQQVSGRVNVEPLQPITLGREVTILGVANEEQLARAIGGQREIERKPAVQEKRFPALISVSEVARPARFLLAPGATVTVGRDPGCDLWLGAPHISRNHCSITFSKTGNLILTDTSTNGTAHDGGILRRGDTLDIKNPKVLDFGGGVTVAICFKLEDERQFAASSGSIWSFTQEGPVRARRFTKGMQAIAAAGDGAGGSPVEALSHFERFKAFCSGLGLMGKVMLSVIVALLGVLCAVVFFLLVSVVR